MLTACTDIITVTEIGHCLGIRHYSLEDALTTCIDVRNIVIQQVRQWGLLKKRTTMVECSALLGFAPFRYLVLLSKGTLMVKCGHPGLVTATNSQQEKVVKQWDLFIALVLVFHVVHETLACFVFSDTDMAARHRARASSIHIIRVEEVAASKCRRANILQFHVSFPSLDAALFVVYYFTVRGGGAAGVCCHSQRLLSPSSSCIGRIGYAVSPFLYPVSLWGGLVKCVV